MEITLISIFVLGYLAITLEHTLKIDKLIPALIMMALLWGLISINHLPVFEVDTLKKALKPSHIDEILLHHLGKTAEIIIFLVGAMTIVEIIDYFNGFATIKGFIKTRSKKGLLVIFSILAFVLSAIIDNLTATIVLITILQKVIKNRDTRLWFSGLIVIAANAGGAWSPIGDVTTTMLWIGDKVTTFKLIQFLLLPSLLCMLVPVLLASYLPAFKGDLAEAIDDEESKINTYGPTMLYIGLSAIVFVPVFKTLTHLPPYIGMMLSLAIVATFAEYYSSAKFSISSIDKDHDSSSDHSAVHSSLSKIELPSILFFLGILLSVAALESLGMLFEFADFITVFVPNSDVVVILLGMASAIIDNVPLVAASMGMFSELTDDPLWHFIAFSAGTGGSMLIIGSAAGVVAMGMEKINFFWYLKKISWLAFVGFFVGSITFILMRNFIF
jgi:Na+/H+ antiporter NhaD/arsenite permease-like protein